MNVKHAAIHSFWVGVAALGAFTFITDALGPAAGIAAALLVVALGWWHFDRRNR